MPGRHAFVEEGAGAYYRVITEFKVVGNNARVGMHPDAVTDNEPDIVLLPLDADGAVLPDLEVLPDLRVGGDDNTSGVGDPQAFTHFGAHHDFHIERAAGFFIEQLGAASPELAVAFIHGVGQAIPEDIAISIVSAALLDNSLPLERFVQAANDFDMPITLGYPENISKQEVFLGVVQG